MVDNVNARSDETGARDAPLDRQLITAALEELAQTPAERLSMRQLADRLGVSHQAPYVHFRNRRIFLAAVAGAGLAAQAAHARRAVEAAGAEPRARLHALVDAYLGFVRADPHLHDLAYGPVVAMADHPRLQAAAIDYWSLLAEVVGACMPPGVPPGDILDRCASAWGLVYGLARLDIHQKIPRSVPSEPARLAHTAIDIMYRGWQT